MKNVFAKGCNESFEFANCIHYQQKVSAEEAIRTFSLTRGELNSALRA